MDIFTKLAVSLLLLLIVGSLAGGMFQLSRHHGESSDTGVVTALTVRIILSLLLFAFLMGGYYFGLIKPHGL